MVLYYTWDSVSRLLSFFETCDLVFMCLSMAQTMGTPLSAVVCFGSKGFAGPGFS